MLLLTLITYNFNPFFSTFFLFPPKNARKCLVSDVFRGGLKGNTVKKWVKMFKRYSWSKDIVQENGKKMHYDLPWGFFLMFSLFFDKLTILSGKVWVFYIPLHDYSRQWLSGLRCCTYFWEVGNLNPTRFWVNNFVKRSQMTSSSKLC